MKRYLIVVAVVLFVLVWLLINYPWRPDYEVVSVPVNDVYTMSLGVGQEDCVSAINDCGQVAGHIQRTGGGYYAYIWDEEHGVVELPKVKGKSCYIRDINNKGQAVGRISDIGFNWRFGESVAFLRDADGTITRLPLEENARTYASGINDKGEVVGFISRGSIGPLGWRMSKRVFVWDKIGGMRIIDEIGDDVEYVCGINEAGQIAGLIGGLGRSQAFVWSESAGLVLLDVKASRIFDIDEEGNVLGRTVYKGRLFVWDELKGVKILGLGGDSIGECKMNDTGDIVGTVYDDGIRFLKKYRLLKGHTTPFLRTRGGKTVAFDPLFEEGERFCPIDINNEGWIVGYVHEWSSGRRRVVLLRRE